MEAPSLRGDNGERYRAIAYIGHGGSVWLVHQVGSSRFTQIWNACPANHRYIVMEDHKRRVLVTDLHRAEIDYTNDISVGEYEVFVDADQAIAATVMKYSLAAHEAIPDKMLRLKREVVLWRRQTKLQ